MLTKSRAYQRGKRNAFGSYPQWMGNPYLDLPAGESGQCRRQLMYKKPNESLNKDSPSTKCQGLFLRTDERLKSGKLIFITMGNYP